MLALLWWSLEMAVLSGAVLSRSALFGSRLRRLQFVLIVGFLASSSAIAPSANAAPADDATPADAPALSAAPPAPASLDVELPEELDDLREMGKDIGDRLSEIDPKVIQQVMAPLGRQALRIFLDSAPELSQKAIDLGEQGLAELEKRATERLEQAQADFEQDAEDNL